MAEFIIIDGSYYCFYRYFALERWWKFAKPDDPLGTPIENDEFCSKFEKTFVDKIKEIPKKLKIKNPIFIVGKDCPRSQIWRNDFTEGYKATRDNNDGFEGGPFFKLAHDKLWNKAGISTILEYPRLEADDCIALTVNRIKETVPNHKIYIIANDHDYLQLADENIKIINLQYKDLSESKNSTGEKECDLFCKIIIGDKSDNIKPVFEKVGIKTAIKFFHDKELFQKKLNSDPKFIIRFNNNKKLIDFNFIPDELKAGFAQNVLLIKDY